MNLDIIEVALDKKHWTTASQRVLEIPIYKGSHRGIKANQVGSLGEVVFEEFLKMNQIKFTDQRNLTTHDYLINDNLTVEIKTKDRTVKPKLYFDNSVPIYNHPHQRPNYFYFISLLRNKLDKTKNISRFTHAFILGATDIFTLEKIGKIWRTGEIDNSNGTQFWTDCINIKMNQLTSNNRMLKIFQNNQF